MNHKPELLAPAGDLEKLKFAVIFGADAVYIGGNEFGLRATARNFTIEHMQEGIQFAHQHGAKVYLTVNIYAHNEDIAKLPDYLSSLSGLDLDGLIVSDLGILSLIKAELPHMPLHLSTQANTTNWCSAQFWQQQGLERIIGARELSLKEIKEITQKVDIEMEGFVHGAMCISYSGRCLLSNFMAGRDANRGLCTHPCRWEYAVVEPKRPGQYFPVIEDERGTYIFNSKDMCMIENIPELIESGLGSLKIEGRMKSVYYVATVTHVYRQALDAYFNDPDGYQFDPQWLEELQKVSHRPFTTGFYFNNPGKEGQNYEDSGYIRDYSFVGVVLDYDQQKKEAVIQQRNHFAVGQEVELFGPHTPLFTQTITSLIDEEGQSVEVAPHPQQTLRMPVDYPVEPYTILRRKDN